MTERRFTLQESFDYFCAQSNLSPASLDTYGYAVKHFHEFLGDSHLAEPLSISGERPQDHYLEELGASRQDVNLITWFINYLGHEVQQTRPRVGVGRSLRLEPATVRLYGQAVITWFRFLADELILPERFPATAAISQAHRRLRTFIPATQARDSAPEPPEGIEDLIHAFDEVEETPEEVPAKEKRRRQLEHLRNRSILYALADSGARVSEILRITADDVRGAKLNRQGIWQIPVRGKGEARGDPGAADLYVSHARTRPDYRGKPFSSNAVWRMIRRTSMKLGLPHIHPHDFRHWRATQMLQEGVPIDQVQRFLNHRSIRTTQLYAKTSEAAVDHAGARTSPLLSDENRSGMET
jgi:site-specific recombinase XerD